MPLEPILAPLDDDSSLRRQVEEAARRKKEKEKKEKEKEKEKEKNKE